MQGRFYALVGLARVAAAGVRRIDKSATHATGADWSSEPSLYRGGPVGWQGSVGIVGHGP